MNLAVPLARPLFGAEEAAAVNQVLASGWVSQGPKVEEFENRLADVLCCREVCAVNSGTSAIMLALRALDIGRGDSVVVPAFSCAASVLPVLEIGARPLFADIDPTTFNVTWDTISKVLEKETKAVLVAHMFGRICDIDVIADECQRRKLVLLEDAALALGARCGERLAGTYGLAGCFSFHPRKIITTGEGGAVCTNDPDLAARVRASRNYGAVQTAWTRFKSGDGSPRGFSRLAYNCKLTDLQAAIGLVQLGHLPQFLAERRKIAASYAARLPSCHSLKLPSVPQDEQEHVFQAYVCTWGPISLKEMASHPRSLSLAEQALKEFKSSILNRGVAVSDAGQFLPDLPVFALQESRHECPYASVAARLSVALPIFPGMTDSDIGKVVTAVEAGLAKT